MARRNRVDPFGLIHAVPQRGTLMGNRGNLHSEAGDIVRPYKRKVWVTCLLEYRGRHRDVMAPGQYTELFFLDEATSFAAGHRPCGTCRREALSSFRSCWARALGSGAGDSAELKDIDAILHSQRTNRQFELVDLAVLPDGVFVSTDTNNGSAYLWWQSKLHEWSFDGYRKVARRRRGVQFQLVTPPCLVDVLKAGYPAAVHESVSE